MKLIKIEEISIPAAMMISGLIVGLSIFFTTWIFFGGDNNRQKLFISNPALSRPTQQTLTPQQIQQMQQQRAALMNQASSTPTQPVAPAPTVKPAVKR